MLRFYVFILLFLSILQFIVSIDIYYTIVPLGCHTFYGTVKCGNGNAIRSDAYVVLKERDDISPDDFIAQSKIVNNVFKLHGCDDSDPPTSELEVYLEFFNVCNNDEYKLSGTLKENEIVIYNIYDTGEYAQIDQ